MHKLKIENKDPKFHNLPYLKFITNDWYLTLTISFLWNENNHNFLHALYSEVV